MKDFTGDGHNLKSLEKLYCSFGINDGVHRQLIVLIALNIFLSITAFLGNSLILVALHKESSLHPPSKLLFRSLATTDLFVGLIVEPLYVVYLMTVVNERWNICYYVLTSSFIGANVLCLVSLLTLAAISVDRLLALLLRLRYRQIFTLKRAFVAVIVFWVVSMVGAVVFFLNDVITVWYAYTVALLCLLTSILSYTKIFFTLRHNQNQVQNLVNRGQPSHAIPLNVARYRKAVSSALWVQLVLFVCYLPYVVVEALNAKIGLSSSVYLTRKVADTLICLNSTLNPILYCWKISEVRQAVKDTIRQFCCSS